MKNLMKFLVLSILIVNILGACQSCKKDPQPDPKPQPVLFNVTAIADGGVTLVPSGTGKVEKGTKVTYTINSGPNKKYQIKKNGVLDSGYLTGNYTYEVTVSADTYIEVVSVDVTFTVNTIIVVSAGGNITPTTTTVNYGGSTILNITKNTGYMIKSIKLNGNEITISDQIKIDNITVKQDVVVEFILIDIYNLTKGADTKTLPWYLKSIEYFDANGNFLRSSNLTGDPRLNYKNYYSQKGATNGSMEMLDQQGVVIVANADWTLVGKVFTQGEVNTVVELTDKIFSYQRPLVQQNGTVETVRLTLWRP